MKLLKTRILIVDDNASDRVVVRAILKSLGCKEIQEAEDGSIADGKIRTAVEIGAPFDLVIMDWNMPRTTGAKLLDSIRYAVKTRNTKLIVMTATADRETVEDAIAGGADDFLVKPVTLDAMKEKLEKMEE